ncbi:dockerin type I domain-containing protein [Paenibacillus sp. SYP-B4298]|uniref:dockerin type I domain-containing protein n=1 Tax=Paenibacillus sp. SYP-B4298 TaxID=2996034 RepID=UPI0022DE5146|nr:dockerin type I domain-containing protein [Paenibacillus sp. SYP-B4298]
MMRGMKKKIALCAVALLLTLPILSSLGGTRVVAISTVGEYPLTYGAKEFTSSPKIDGGHIVYTVGSNVYMYDTASKQKRQLTTSGKANSPEIRGNHVVWAENRDGTTDIFLYDIMSQEETRITHTDSVYEVKPLLAGSERLYIVYGIGKGIYLYDTVSRLSEKINTISDTDTSVQNGYSVSGNRVVWHEYRPNPAAMSFYLYTIGSNGIAVPIAPDANKAVSQPNLSIYEDKLVWMDRRTGSSYSNIYLYDLADDSGRFLDPRDNNQSAPVMDDGKVVWLDNRSGKNQVFSYDLSSSSGTSVTTSDVAKSSVDSFGNTIVWVNGKNIYANADIGPRPIEALNQAADAETMRDLMESAEIGLALGDYANWSKLKDKQAVGNSVWSSRPDQGFASLADVQAAMDAAIVERSPIARVNTAYPIAVLAEALNNPDLGLDMSAYQALGPKDRAAAVQTFSFNRAYEGFDTLEQMQWALDEAVLAWSSSQFHYIDDMDMNGWFGDIAADSKGKLYAAYTDDDHGGKATLRRYDQASSSWLPVGGSGFSDHAVKSVMAIAFDSHDTPYVAFSDEGNGKRTTVMKFNGTTWETVGKAGFTASGYPYYLSFVIGAGDVPYVSYSETGAGGRGHVMKFNGTDWVQAASNNPMSSGARFIHLELDSAGTPYIGFNLLVGTSFEARVMKLDGNTWRNVGNPPANLNPYYMEFAIGDDDTLYIDMVVSSQYVVFKYDAAEGKWMELEQEQSMSLTGAHRLVVHGEALYMASPERNDNNRATIMKLQDGVWSPIETPGFTDIAPDGEYSKMLWVDDVLYFGFLVRSGPRGNLTAVMANHHSDTAPVYTIGAIQDVELPELSERYLPGEQPATSIAIKKTGTGVLTNVKAELGGNHAADFELTQPTLGTLKKFNPMTPLTIKPRDGLAAGTYTATVTVTADLAEAVSFTITQTVKPAAGGYQVTYDAGQYGVLDGEASEEVPAGSYPSAVPVVMANEGYAFVGWSKDGGATKLSSEEVAAAAVTGAVTYTAHYLLMGDANGDGKVTNADALLLTKFIKNSASLTAEQKAAVDMNGDNNWDWVDVQMILSLCVGKGGQTNG